MVAMIIQEGTRVISEFIKNRPPKRHEAKEPLPTFISEEATEMKAAATPVVATEVVSEKVSTQEGTACIPCVNGHFSVCSGLISDEALRMARRHGIGDEEISRINKCLDQLNALEREDLAVDKLSKLPQWEKELAIYAQVESASIRHDLETLTSVDDLEKVALKIKTTRMKIGATFFKEKLKRMPEEDKKQLAKKALEKLEEV